MGGAGGQANHCRGVSLNRMCSLVSEGQQVGQRLRCETKLRGLTNLTLKRRSSRATRGAEMILCVFCVRACVCVVCVSVRERECVCV